MDYLDDLVSLEMNRAVAQSLCLKFEEIARSKCLGCDGKLDELSSFDYRRFSAASERFNENRVGLLVTRHNLCELSGFTLKARIHLLYDDLLSHLNHQEITALVHARLASNLLARKRFTKTHNYVTWLKSIDEHAMVQVMLLHYLGAGRKGQDDDVTDKMMLKFPLHAVVCEDCERVHGDDDDDDEGVHMDMVHKIPPSEQPTDSDDEEVTMIPTNRHPSPLSVHTSGGASYSNPTPIDRPRPTIPKVKLLARRSRPTLTKLYFMNNPTAAADNVTPVSRYSNEPSKKKLNFFEADSSDDDSIDMLIDESCDDLYDLAKPLLSAADPPVSQNGIEYEAFKEWSVANDCL